MTDLKQTAAVLAFCLGLIVAAPAPARAAAAHSVVAGTLNVQQVSELDTNENAEVTLGLSVNHFQAGPFNRGDFGLLVGTGVAAQDDHWRGVLMSSVIENGRTNFGTNGFPISAFDTNGSGTFRITTFLAAGTNAGEAIEYNVNVAGAWFPYDRYLAGFARNAADVNGGPNDLLTASPGVVLGTHYRDLGGGRSIVDLRSFGVDSRSSGVLLVNHAKDENNFALSQVNTADGTWNVFVRDNAQSNYGNYEQDPVAFVFIPKTNAALISGRFNGNGSIAMFSGNAPRFSVLHLGTGRWKLTIPGHSPTNGVLIISPEGGGNLNGDNIVSYQPSPDGTGWEIQSRDTPNNFLQTPEGASGEPEAAVSFVYVPQPPPGITVSATNELITTGSGGTASFSVVLDSSPAALVTVGVSSSDPAKGSISPSTLLFGANNWYLPQTVTVKGQTGANYGTYTISLAPAVSSDPAYNGLDPQDLSVLSLPERASLLWPADGAKQIRTSPTLQVMITNPTPGNLKVEFHGRAVGILPPGPDFSIAVLPDTQMYTAELDGGTKEMMIAQTEWAIANRISRNVAYVTQLGDISNNGDNPARISQWYNATNAMYRLENPVRTQLPYGMPYGVALGNHEQTPNGDAIGGTTTNFNRYFGVQHFTGKSYYAGHYGTNNNNHFDFFSVSGLDFVVLYFEYDTNPPPEVLAWGNEVLRTNAHRRAIAVTHYFGSPTTPSAFSAQGGAIYNALKTNANLFLMMAGHVSGEGSRVDTFNGNTVRTLIADYQFRTNGGNGWMRILDFSPSNNVVVVQTYSPVTGEYETDEDSEFFFPYDMQRTGPGAAGPYLLLGTNTGVAPGSIVSCAWSGLETNKAYEWFVKVTDGSGISVTSPVWRFTTASTNNAPTVVNLARTIFGDTPTNLTLLANDVNGDPLTFTTTTAPQYGVLQNLNTNTGAVTYWPAHGFRGTDRFIFRASDGQATSSSASMNLTIISPPDTNANNLPDDWETAYAITDPAADSDGDGQSNLEEFYGNTNPTNASSFLRITGTARNSSGHVDLDWPSVGGTRYRVQFSNGKPGSSPTGVFLDAIRPLTNEMALHPPGSLSTQTFTDDFTLTGPATNGVRYYRIKVLR